MKRTPIERKTPLASGDSHLRRTPLARTAPPTRKVPAQRNTRAARPAKRARPTGATVDTRQIVVARDLVCLVCGGPGTNVQHREGRGAGGRGKADTERTNGVAWLFLICGQGNTSGCHKAIDSDPTAVAKGWIIRRNTLRVDAAEVPILCFDGWHLLDNDGCRVPCDAPVAS